MTEEIVNNSNGPLGGIFKRYFQSTWSQVVAAVTGVSIAAIGTMFSPLGDYLRDKLFPEKVEINQTISATEGKETPFTIALTDVSAGAKISGGRVEISSVDDSVILKGPLSFSFEPADGSIDVAPKEGLSLISRKPGESKLNVTVSTNKGERFSGVITIKAEAGEKTKPTTDNLSGQWRFVLNKREGELTLAEKGYRFVANGHFDDGTELEGSGWRDGDIFRLTLRQLDGVSFSTEGIYCEVKQGASHFVIVNSKVVTKMNGAALKSPVPFDTIKQRCPKFGIVRGYDGDGAFFALVPLS